LLKVTLAVPLLLESSVVKYHGGANG